MDAEQIKLVKLSFARVAAQEQEAGRLFYQRLFEIAPETRALFQNDLQAQERKLIQMLGIAVGMLNDPKALDIVLQSLGKRHARYGVQEDHFEQVGEALIWMLEQICGEDFTPQVRRCWIAAYNYMAYAMKRAMRVQRRTA